MKQLALLLVLNIGCAKHPVIIVAATAATIGRLSCEADDGTAKVCALTTAIVAVALGGLAALVTEFADTNAHQLPPDEEITTGGTLRLHTHTAPPPVPLDAGIADAPIADAPIADAI